MEQSDLNLMQKFKEFIGTFMDSLAVQANKTKPRQTWDHHRKMVLENSYHLTSKHYSRKELSFLFGLSEGRVRQINNETIARIRAIIREVNPDIFTLYYLEDIKKLDSFLREERVWPKTKFYAYFNEKCEVDTEQEKPFINLLVDVLGYKILKNQYSLLKDNDLVFFDDMIDRDIFFRICHESFITLEKKDFPTRPEDMITSVKSNLNQFTTDDSLIDKALNVINDFEVVIRNDTKFYQVAFHRLRSAGDMVYRILFENENWMKLSDINHEIKHRLSLKNKKVTDWKNLYAAIINDKRLLPLAKSGVWTLTEWGEENLIIYELITNTLLHFNKPLIKEDIFSHILKTRPFIRTHSLNSAIYNSRFMQLRDKKFILSEWKDLYQKKTTLTRKKKTY